VLAGVAAGDRIVSTSATSVRAGDRVRITNAGT